MLARMSRAIGKTASTTATTEVPVEGSTYTEPTSSAQLSIVSSNAADAAAGTGARTVKITYFTLAADGVTVTGPFTEIVTLNGTAAVNTVGTALCYIERMDVMTVGSGGVPAGTLSLHAAIAGGGGVVASINAGELSTFLAHHYVASGHQCHVLDINALGGNATSAIFELKKCGLPTSAGVEQPFMNGIAASNVTSTQITMPDPDRVVVAGPARLRLYVAPANSTAQVNQGSFGFRDEQL
jgi:hypothetical protein